MFSERLLMPASTVLSSELGWSYYGQRAAAYLMGERVIPVYKAAFLLAAVAGC